MVDFREWLDMSGALQGVFMNHRSFGPPPTQTFAIFALGNTSLGRQSIRNKYTYAGDVVSTGGAATVSSQAGSAAGNSTVGIFALGVATASAASTTRDKYTYSGDVVSAGGAATEASTSGSAASNGTTGVNM